MQCRPFHDHPQHPRRQAPNQHGTGLNLYYSSMLAGSHVEVWRWVIVIIHRHDDTEESTDLGHSDNVERQYPGCVIEASHDVTFHCGPVCVLGEAERRLRGILHRGPMDLKQTRVDLPPPDLEPREITMEQYHAYAPEKFELWGGYLFLPAEYPELRQQLLKLLLVNMGLREAVRMAPKAAWREALERVYGEE